MGYAIELIPEKGRQDVVVLLLPELARDLFPEPHHAQSVFKHLLAKQFRQQLRELSGGIEGFKCRPLWLTGEDLVALQEQLPEQEYRCKAAGSDHFFRHDHRHWKLQTQDMPRRGGEQTIFRLVIGRRAKLPPLGEIPKEDFPWDRLLED